MQGRSSATALSSGPSCPLPAPPGAVPVSDAAVARPHLAGHRFERLEHREANPPPYARPINRRYYWIDFKHFSDVVRWRMDVLFHSLDKKLRAVRPRPPSLPHRLATELTPRATRPVLGPPGAREQGLHLPGLQEDVPAARHPGPDLGRRQLPVRRLLGAARRQRGKPGGPRREGQDGRLQRPDQVDPGGPAQDGRDGFPEVRPGARQPGLGHLVADPPRFSRTDAGSTSSSGSSRTRATARCRRRRSRSTCSSTPTRSARRASRPAWSRNSGSCHPPSGTVPSLC